MKTRALALAKRAGDIVIAILEFVADAFDDVRFIVKRWGGQFLKHPLDTLARFVAFTVPRRVVYWCAIRMLNHASSDKWEGQRFPTKTNELLLRWEEKQPKEKVDA